MKYLFLQLTYYLYQEINYLFMLQFIFSVIALITLFNLPIYLIEIKIMSIARSYKLKEFNANVFNSTQKPTRNDGEKRDWLSKTADYA